MWREEPEIFQRLRFFGRFQKLIDIFERLFCVVIG